MKYKLFTLAVAVLMTGLLGSCSDNGKRLDDLEQRTAGIEGDSIAGLNQQISAIEASIADLEAIRTSIQALTASREAQGADVTALQSADEAIGARIRGLEDYVGDLSRYAEKDWATAMFATLDQHNRTAEMLQALGVTVGKLDERLSAAIQEAGDNLGAAIQALSDRISAVETKVQAIDGQISAIEASIADLEAIRTSIQALKAAKEAQGEDITALKAADGMLAQKIEDLRDYVDNELKKYATTEWVDATFATLAKQEEILADIAKLKQDLEVLDGKLGDAVTQLDGKLDGAVTQLRADLDEAIFGLESSMKAWVNGQLSAYYTAAQMDVKIAGLQSEIDALKTDNETNKSKIEELVSNLATLTQDLDEAKATIKTGYEAAITAAINENNGTINQTVQTKIDEVNDTMAALADRVTVLDTAVGVLTGRVDALEAMIQSVTIVPAYSDGSVESTKDGFLYLDIIVSPAEAVATLTKDCLKVMVNEVKTRAVDVDTVVVTKFKADAAKGTITARADISSKLHVASASGKALTIAVNVRNGISDYTTEFCPVTLSSEPNVTVKDETDTTKVTIKADEDFPESSAGNIVVADGFKDSKPTAVDIEVGGKGTVIFDAKATSQIKANAGQAGATSVFFKVEDVTTTKPVENADVVLEVTMKTVDEKGTEVFSKENAGEGAEVTIEIPIPEEKDVAYVNSVTLVNDAGEPIQGGVVPGSEDFDKEKGILTFKVNHFSKYAIDYVTNDQFKAVTGVSIEPVSVTLQVGDNLKLVANIAPEDATNKRVTWSSSDTTKVKVDDTGKITAVAFGNATITVTTKDGNKTADCTVEVSETKTMADILKTTTGIPESQNLTPPANAWVNSTNTGCKAFIGKDGGKEYFVIKKEGQPSASLKLRMDDTFERIDDNTYKRVEPSVGTFTIKMKGGKFTSYIFEAASGSDYAALNGTYSAPVSKEYVEIEAKYDGQNVSVRRWYRQSLAITDSGKKAWKGGSGSPVKVPGTGEDVVVGDYFQWGTYAGFYGSGAGTDKGLLSYDSFTHKGCGDGSDAFTFKDGKQFNEEENAPYWSGSAYTKYNATDKKTELDASDDVASIILGGTWRMPTTKEFQALKEVTYWKWDATDKGYYVFNPMEGDAGKINDETSNTYENADALLFFPAVGMGNEGTLYSDDNSIAFYLSRTLSLYSNLAHAYTMSIDKSEIHPDEEEITARGFGFSVRPVQDPNATYVAVTNVSLDVTAKEIEAGGNVQLKVTVAPATATQNGVYWTSSDTTVAKVDALGKVTAVAVGTATITATTVDGSKTATCTVTVTAPVTTFKAVYNTNGGANTLTFYYDAIDHSEEGITVYEDGTANYLFNNSQSNGKKWGYNDNRGEIKSVVIDASVAGYKGLTSTTFMFQGMATASSISGAEYLDVSNVTDMSFMFNNFGGGNANSHTTLNSVPNVSGWNTGNVTTMTGMFESYGNFSSSLDKVPDVSGWNTGKVTDMACMFQKYGHESQNFNAVPDVSKWNIGKVEDMHQMFFEYGHKSTALNTVPDVSGWNTGKVTNMSGMFNGYGYTSTNISCVLDLSGWDLSKITGTNGNNVFAFNPKTFNVTIPAKTGAKSNEGGKWYYGNGTNYIAPPTGKFTPTLAGVFSVSATKKVHFSQGNLVATIDASGAPTAWKFAANQYDCLGTGGANKTIGATAGDVDLFGWSTAKTTYGISNSKSVSAYSGDFVDWGKAYCEKNSIAEGTWCTLTNDEWTYMFNNHSKKWATVNGVKGYVIAPDGFAGTLSETYADDAALAANNLVFLPAAGNRSISGVEDVGVYGYYWSSTAEDQYSAYRVGLLSRNVGPASATREYGCSVRLVKEVPAAGVSGNGTEQYNNNSNPDWFSK